MPAAYCSMDTQYTQPGFLMNHWISNQLGLSVTGELIVLIPIFYYQGYSRTYTGVMEGIHFVQLK